MNGVHILNEYQIVSSESMNWPLFGIIVASCFVGAFIISLIVSIANKSYCGMFFATIAFGILFSLILFPLSYKTYSNKTYETAYEVIIDDTVNLNEFTSKYNIIEQRGEIYVVTEKP